MEYICQQFINILSDRGKYIETNSIDFISMVASILIAIETNKWIEKGTEKKEKKHLVEELLAEIDMVNEKLKQDEKDDVNVEKLTLRIMPYNLPVWNSIKNTNKINLLTESNGYKEILEFYSEICELNEWETTLTHYVLFIQYNQENKEDDFYRELLVAQVSEQRKKVISLAEVARRTLKEG